MAFGVVRAEALGRMRNVAIVCTALFISAIAVAGMPLPFETSLSLRYDLKASELLASEQQRLRDFLEAMASKGQQCQVMVVVASREGTSGLATSMRDLLHRYGIANVHLHTKVALPAGEVHLVFTGSYGPPGCAAQTGGR